MLLNIRRRNDIYVATQEGRIDAELQRRVAEDDDLPAAFCRQRFDQAVDHSASGCFPVKIGPPCFFEWHGSPASARRRCWPTLGPADVPSRQNPRPIGGRGADRAMTKETCARATEFAQQFVISPSRRLARC